MYWAVAGTIFIAELTVEWLVNWFARDLLHLLMSSADCTVDNNRIPFYYELKTLVILWLTLPQIQVRFSWPSPRSIAEESR